MKNIKIFVDKFIYIIFKVLKGLFNAGLLSVL